MVWLGALLLSPLWGLSCEGTWYHNKTIRNHSRNVLNFWLELFIDSIHVRVHLYFLLLMQFITNEFLSSYSGIFTVAGIIDSSIYYGKRTIKKMELGKYRWCGHHPTLMLEMSQLNPHVLYFAGWCRGFCSVRSYSIIKILWCCQWCPLFLDFWILQSLPFTYLNRCNKNFISPLLTLGFRDGF